MTDAPCIHPTADVQTNQIGARTRIWQYVVILDGAQIGADCNICSHCFIEGGVRIGNRVTIKNGVSLFNGLIIDDDVFIGPNVSFTNDLFPRSGDHSKSIARTVVGKNASLGAGCIVLAGIEIGESAMLGAGAVVTKSVDPHTVVVGNPAKPIRSMNRD